MTSFNTSRPAENSQFDEHSSVEHTSETSNFRNSVAQSIKDLCSFSPRTPESIEKVVEAGEGNFGKVFLGHSSTDSSVCAIKVPKITAHDETDREIREQMRKHGFLYELGMAEKLYALAQSDPNFPQTLMAPLGIVSDPTSLSGYGLLYTPYTVAENTTTTLGAEIRRKNPVLNNMNAFGKPESSLTYTDIAQIFTDVLQALDYLHSHGWAHLDLKMENIALWKDSNDQIRGAIIDIGTLSGLGAHTPQSSTLSPTKIYPTTQNVRHEPTLEHMKSIGNAVPQADHFAIMTMLKGILDPRFYRGPWTKEAPKDLLDVCKSYISLSDSKSPLPFNAHFSRHLLHFIAGESKETLS